MGKYRRWSNLTDVIIAGEVQFQINKKKVVQCG